MLEPSLYFQQTNYLSQPINDLFATIGEDISFEAL